jgi:hypothetical protein
MTFLCEICVGLCRSVSVSFETTTKARKPCVCRSSFPKDKTTTYTPRTRLPPWVGLPLRERHYTAERSTPHKGFLFGLYDRPLPRRRAVSGVIPDPDGTRRPLNQLLSVEVYFGVFYTA